MTTALVTGATAGIGRAFCDELARTGHDLVLVARDTARLEELAGDLRATHGVNAEVLTADLSDRKALDRVAHRLTSTGEDAVDLLVNNAGFGLKTSFLDSDIADEERQLDVLVRAVLVLSHSAGQAMRDRGRGHILNVSSVAGFTTMGTYAACKTFVTTFSQAVANDLTGTGVGVTALCPGYVRTEFHQRMGASMGGVPARLWLRAEDVVRAALADARAGRVISVPGVQYRAIAAATDVLPRELVRRLTRGIGGSKRAVGDRTGRTSGRA